MTLYPRVVNTNPTTGGKHQPDHTGKHQPDHAGKHRPAIDNPNVNSRLMYTSDSRIDGYH